MLSPVPVIVLDDAVFSPSKRRRIGPEGERCPIRSSPGTHSEQSKAPDISADTDISPNTVVCFGMIADRPVTSTRSTLVVAPSVVRESVQFAPTGILYRCDNEEVGRPDDYTCKMLSRLVADDGLILQLILSATPIAGERDAKCPKGTTGFLEILVYGPKCRSGDVGDFITRCGCYLEDPVDCDRNVPYLNPQCLFSLHERPPMTFDLERLRRHSVDEFIQTRSDILAGFETTDHFEETVTPTALRTTLKVHQQQALTFLLRRERGLHPTEDGFGIWSRRLNGSEESFVNIITSESQPTPGPIWRGGLLADEMGLGKTLSIIALIALDKDSVSVHSPLARQRFSAVEIPSTLIIVPLTVLTVWESQLRDHVHSGKLTWFNHHGKNRLQLSNITIAPDIVFTTYQTIERENRGNKLKTSSLFAYHWKRVVLDEAHIIRNHNTSTARAITAIRATSRWAISGTPIQNNLTDFLGLFKFLHFAPYDDPRVFDDDISNLWRTRPVDEAAETFKKLLSSVMIRRTKTILDLPSREDKIIRLSFNDLEEEYYRHIEQPVVELLDQPGGERSSPSNSWMNVIQQINKLRLVCNLGTFVPSRQPELSQLGGSDGKQAVLVARLSMGGEVCEQCLQPIPSTSFGDELEGSNPSSVYYSTCDRLFCAGCAGLLHYQATEPCVCMEHSSSCPLLPLVSFSPTPMLSPIGGLSPSQMDTDDASQISSKVQALISQIKAYPDEKHVVFSSWTSSLDMVERGLRTESILSVRIDGKVTTKKRNHAMQQLHSNPNIRVILITIACGACGLDLTAASRVHLLEPQWNPSLEDQALARAHRLGQNRPVTTIRYVMKNSLEEHIIKVQDRKKLLATTLLSDVSSLENLRQLLHKE